MKLKAALSILIILFLSSCASTNYKVNLIDTTLRQGGVTLFNLDARSAKHDLSASFSGGEVFIVTDDAGTWGIIATDLETEPGSYELRFKKGRKELLREMAIVGASYGSESFTLPKGMVKLDTKDTERVDKETALLSEVWTKSSAEPLWRGPFIMPVKGRTSAEFGLRRTMNNTARPPHSGMDIAAPRGTPVKAANNGTVAFVGDFFFNGKFVVIDHGLGIFTVYAHLSSIMAKTGEAIEKGAELGKVGSTGRSTGPHLHFGVKVGRVRVSPKELFKLLSDS